jgi:25S rRNA (uracil2843-N3)-methyltransferase
MREVFCVRWGVERGLVLAALLVDWADGAFEEEGVFQRLRTGGLPLDVVSLGNGVAEVMALAALLRHLEPGTAATGDGQAASEETDPEAKKAEGSPPVVNLQLVQPSDNWATETNALYAALLAPPVLSKYASVAAKAAARPFLPQGSLDLHHLEQNLLEDGLQREGLEGLVGDAPCLFTVCFLLGEMQRVSVPMAVKSLLSITEVAPKGSMLVVVDDVESDDAEETSNIGKKYPLRFLLDLALLGKGVQSEGEADDEEDEASRPPAPWERLVGDEERVFKIDPSLQYPLSLGKVRVQVHLFRRT